MAETIFKETNKPNLTLISPSLIGILFFSFYVLGEIFPDYWWSTHSSHFVSYSLKYACFAVSILCLIISLFPHQIEKLLNLIPNQFNTSVFIWSISLLMGFLFYQSPMVADFYGEASVLKSPINTIVSKISQETYNNLFSFGLNPWDGQKTILSLITYLAYFTGESLYSSFLYFDAFFGFCFVFTWLSFINNSLKKWAWKAVLTIAICLAPFLLNFYGHIEINAIVLWVNLLWIIKLVKYIGNKTATRLWGLFLLLIICLKIHAITLLFAPIWVLLCVSYYSKSTTLISWKKVSAFVLAPIFAAGAFLYFIVFKDYADPRNLDYTIKEYDRLFLPIVSPEAPLDKYNLFSFNHLFDYFSELLLWSPVGIMLFIIIIISYRKVIDWQKEEVVVTCSLFILFFCFFFVLNPLLSMQMGWDLFTFPTPIFLVFLVVLIKEIEHTNLEVKALLLSLAIAVLSIPFFTVHFSKVQLSNKLESLGTRIYYTYYEWSSQTIHNALILISDNREYQFERKNNLLYKLKEYAVVGNDREYGLLWSKEGAYLLDFEKNPATAYVYLEKGLDYYPKDNYARLLLLESCFLLTQYDQAYELSLSLSEANYPDEQTASITQVQAALFSEKYESALEHSGNYLTKWKNDTMMQIINVRLKNNDRIEDLKTFFYAPK